MVTEHVGVQFSQLNHRHNTFRGRRSGSPTNSELEEYSGPASIVSSIVFVGASYPKQGGIARDKHPCAECVLSAVAFPAANVVNAEKAFNVLTWLGGMVNIFPQNLDAVAFEVC